MTACVCGCVEDVALRYRMVVVCILPVGVAYIYSGRGMCSDLFNCVYTCVSENASNT